MTGRVLLLEPALIDARGHQALAVERFAALIGPARTRIVAGLGWRGPPQLAGCPVLPFFKRHRLDVARLRRYGPVGGRLISSTQRIAAPALPRRWRQAPAGQQFPIACADATGMRSLMAGDVAACLIALHAGPEDHVFIPSGDAELLLATATLLADQDRGPAIHLRLMYDDVGAHATDPTWRSALKVLLRAPRARERVQLLAETSAFANAMQDITGSGVALLPHPSPLTATAAPASAEEFVYYLPGEFRADKGAHLVPKIIAALAGMSSAGCKRLRLRVHGKNLSRSQSITVEHLALYAATREYAGNWQQAHAGLLLHDPGVYRLRGSGVVCDAVASGKPFVCLQGNSLAWWGARGNALAAEPDPLAIAQAMCQLMHDYHRHAAASAQAAAAFPMVLREGLGALLV
jgi:hypothetical protein